LARGSVAPAVSSRHAGAALGAGRTRLLRQTAHRKSAVSRKRAVPPDWGLAAVLLALARQAATVLDIQPAWRNR